MEKQKLRLYLFRLRKFIERSTSIDYLEKYTEEELNLIDMLENNMYIIRRSSDARVSLRLENEVAIGEEPWNKDKELRAKYILFGTMLGIIDGEIKEKLNQGTPLSNISHILNLRDKVVNSYNSLKFENSIEEIDLFIMNYPSSKNTIDNYLSLQKKYNDFNHCYFFGYSKKNNIDFNKISYVIENILENIVKYEQNNKEYIKMKSGS